MVPGEKPDAPRLTVRPVVEEFKAFVQHKIEVLEKFRNVEQLKVFLDAMELGMQTIREIQQEAREPEELTEVEFQGSPAILGGAGEGEVDTEELETEAGEEADEEWSLAKAGEVLVGEDAEEDEVAAEVEETSDEGEDADKDPEDETNETNEEGDVSPKGVLACQWEAMDEGGEEDGEEAKESEDEEPPSPDADDPS
ncbi:MAG: hypothetical protein ACYS47_03840 [Planctomycetota bacterium]|jgi:hypothetical protein